MPISTDILTPAVEGLVNSLIKSSAPRADRTPIQTYVQMVRTNPMLGIGADLRILLGLSMLEEYSNPNREHQSFVRSNLNEMKGSFKQSVASMLSFLPFGHSFTEKPLKQDGRWWRLDTLKLVDPRKFTYDGTLGDGITEVVYRGVSNEIRIPYDQGIHFVNQSYLEPSNSPYGIALCERAVPYWQLLGQVQSSLAIASKRQATPIMVGKTNTDPALTTVITKPDGSVLTGSDGQPIYTSQGAAMLRTLNAIENSSVAVIDINDELMAIAQQTDGALLFRVLHYLNTQLLLCFAVPQTVVGTSEGGSGDSNLNQGHRETLRLVTRSQMEMVADGLVENLVRPLIDLNFGPQEDYGSFPVAQEDSSDTVELLNAIDAITREGGVLSPPDLEVINRARQLSGVSTIDVMPTRPVVTLPSSNGNGSNGSNGDRSFFLTHQPAPNSGN